MYWMIPNYDLYRGMQWYFSNGKWKTITETEIIGLTLTEMETMVILEMEII